VLVRVTSWIVLSFLDKGMIHEITRTKHETRYHGNRLLRQSRAIKIGNSANLKSQIYEHPTF